MWREGRWREGCSNREERGIRRGREGSVKGTREGHLRREGV